MLILIAVLLLAGAQTDDVELAKDALAKELGVAPASLKLRSQRAARWPDSSLGCPQRGQSYLEMATEGHKVVLESGGRDYEVHVAGSTAVICSPRRPNRIAPVGPRAASPVAGPAAAPIASARKDLAERLQIDPAKVETISARSTTWPDASLGCPEPGMSYAQMETKGYVIELQAQGKKYTYHSDLRRAVPCDK